MRLWMGSELTRSEASRRSEIYPYIRIAPDAGFALGAVFRFANIFYVFCKITLDEFCKVWYDIVRR